MIAWMSYAQWRFSVGKAAKWATKHCLMFDALHCIESKSRARSWSTNALVTD